MSITHDMQIVGAVIKIPAYMILSEYSTEVSIFKIANGIQPIKDELLTKNAREIDKVIYIIFLSSYGFNLPK